jgi:hypothetical protein
MSASHVIRRALSSLIVVLVSVPVFAQSEPSAELRQAQEEVERLKQELAAMRAQYDARLTALEQKLSGLPAPAQVQPAPVPTPTPATPGEPALPLPPVQASGLLGAKVFNPDIAVIGNFLGAAGENPNRAQPAFGLNEVETSLQAIVDPYARADVFLSAGPEGLEVEEGYVTFNTLPGDLLLKVGKMRAQFGKVNTMHSHVLPWTDRPLVTQNLVGGEEGISDPGLSISHLIHNPFMFLEATGEAYFSDSEVFQSSERSRLSYVGRLRAYRDLTEGTNLDVGGSFAYGPNDAAPLAQIGADLRRRLFGFDATFRYRPLRRAIYRRLIARTEFVWSQPRAVRRNGDTAMGFYGSGEYQFARRWFAGVRFDRSGQAFDPSIVDKGGSILLTYWPSEFNQVRGQYRHIRYGDGNRGNEFLFQFLFSIGAHGAHVF